MSTNIDKNVKIYSIIPARYNSVRFEGKPLADILGKPMIQHVYENSCFSKYSIGTIVATDDARIKSKVESFGGVSILTSKDHPSGTDRVAEVAKNLDADIIINIQGDEPLISSQTIDSIVEPFLVDDSILMTTAVTTINENEYGNQNIVKVVTDNNNYALYFSRSLIPFPRNPFQKKPYRHLGLYAYRKDFLLDFVTLPQGPLEETESLEQLRALEYGYKIKCIYVDENSISVDTAADLEKVIFCLKEERFS